MGTLGEAHFTTDRHESVLGQVTATACFARNQVEQMGTQAASQATTSRLRKKVSRPALLRRLSRGSVTVVAIGTISM